MPDRVVITVFVAALITVRLSASSLATQIVPSIVVFSGSKVEFSARPGLAGDVDGTETALNGAVHAPNTKMPARSAATNPYFEFKQMLM
jgi:hypothetical protein